MFKRFGMILLCAALHCVATEVLHPVLPPATNINIEATFELNDDVYSLDSKVSAEFSPVQRFSLYIDASFRFLSYSYEYSTEGYIHNYCNLHVNGFNETYLGLRSLVYKNIGVDVSWRLPPGEGSQLQRFHRLSFEPFTYLQISHALTVGTSFRYNKFLEDKNYEPGDEVGFKASFVWKLGWDDSLKTGWKFSETFLYGARIKDSENKNLDKPYRKMDDRYRGFKMRFDAMRSFNLLGLPIGIGIDYEIHKGHLFGFETGHRIGAYLNLL